MNKCIWYITKYLALPSDGSPGGRSFLIMKALAGLGNQCVLIGSDSNALCAMPKFTGSSYNAKFDGMQVVLLKTFKYRFAKSLRRVLSWVHFEWKLLRYSKTELPQPDVVIISSLSLLTILNGFILKFRYKCRLVFEIRDIWPLTLTEDGGFSKYNFLVYCLSLVEKYGYRYADIIVGTMPNLGEHVENILGFHKPVYCIPMGIPEDALRNTIPLSIEYRQKYIPNDKFIVGYAGTLGITNALDIFFQCAEKMQDNAKICFLVIGNGDLRDGYISRYGHLPNVIFAPAVDKYAVQSVLDECDLLYLSAFKSKIFDYGQSLNKLIDYMLSAKPILASYSGYPSMINEAGCGTFIPAGNLDLLEQEILRYSMLSEHERSIIGSRGRNWLLQNRRYHALAEQYSSIIFEVAKKNQQITYGSDIKVLSLCKYGGAANFSDPTRLVFIGQSLSKMGVDYLLVSSKSVSKEYPKFNSIFSSYSVGRYHEMVLNGPKISLGLNAMRALSWAFYELMIWINVGVIRKFRPTVIYVSSLSILTFVSGVFLKCLFRVPLVIEVRDIHPLTLIEFGRFTTNSLAVKFLSAIERFGYQNADLLVSPLENFQEHAKSVSHCTAPFLWLPMGFSDIYQAANIDEISDVIVRRISDLKATGKFVICYAGTFGVANDLERVFHIAKSGLPANIHFIFIGDGPLKQGFEANFGNLSNISFFASIPKSDVPKVLAHCDLLINTWKDIDLYRFGVSPNKWIDYALSKRPFLTTLQADLKVKTIAGNAFVTPDGSDSALRSEIIRISQLLPEQLTEMGQKGYDYVIQNLSYDKLAADLKAALSETIARYHAGAKA